MAETNQNRARLPQRPARLRPILHRTVAGDAMRFQGVELGVEFLGEVGAAGLAHPDVGGRCVDGVPGRHNCPGSRSSKNQVLCVPVCVLGFPRRPASPRLGRGPDGVG